MEKKGKRKVKIKSIIEDNSFFSDDTILTVAIADAIINNKTYETTLKEYAIKYGNKIPQNTPYFKTMFSSGFTEWAKGNYQGQSSGNGAMMRVSPVGYLFNTEEDVIKNSYLATTPSHNSKDAINAAQIIALISLSLNILFISSALFCGEVPYFKVFSNTCLPNFTLNPDASIRAIEALIYSKSLKELK